MRFLGIVLLLITQQTFAAELKPATQKAFAHYTQVAEARMQSEIAAASKENKPFLWVDTLEASRKQATLERLKNGEVVTEKLEEKEQGANIEVPSALVHHWIGSAFIPGGNVASAVAVLQDYNHHKDLYKPQVADSRLISRNGNDFKVYLRFYQKKVIAVTMNTEHSAHYETISGGNPRAFSNSHTTRVAEVENAGTKDEREKPVGHDNGFLWALNSYFRMEEKDGGVYVQCEAISLTRDIPTGLGWMFKPYITEVPRESLYTTLNQTRVGLLQATAKK
jgi:ureidoglycolate hydrolase